jgi:thiamine biosynthesis lipoprotein
MTPNQQHSRRDFLRGKAAAQTLAEGLPAQENPSPQGVGQGGYLVSIERRAMACDFEIQFPAHHQQAFTEHALRAFDLIDALEAQMTIYRDDSELLRLNRTAAEQPVAVEPRLFEVLKLAGDLYHQTSGAIDITSSPLSRIWGFTRREGRVPQAEELRSALEIVGFENVVLNDQERTVSFRRKGVELNLNSMGKGYALDRAAELLREAGVSDFLFHGGKSSILARGGNPAEGLDHWTVGLRDPLRPERRLAELVLRNQALSTSGSATQFFRHEGHSYGHILDPRTGWPAEGVLTATAIAPSAVLAEALSTAFYVMGPAAVEAYCAEHPEVGAALVCPGLEEETVRLLAFGANREDWHRPSF